MMTREHFLKIAVSPEALYQKLFWKSNYKVSVPEVVNDFLNKYFQLGQGLFRFFFSFFLSYLT